MKNILLFGASITHGLGGPQGGWADKLKASLHRDMYGEDAVGELCGVYELGVPGATTADLLDRFENEIRARVATSPDDTCIVLLTGTNDAKAVQERDNFLTTPEEFRSNMEKLLDIAKKYSSHVLVAGLTPVDERKVNPKYNPITNTYSYFTNERIVAFEQAAQQAAETAGATSIPLHAIVPANWEDTMLFTDGVHPNDAGHKWICSQIEPVVRKAIGGLV